MKLIFSIIIILLINNNICGQRSLTKDEILSYWNTSYKKKNKDSITIVNSTSALNAFLLKLVDSLRSNSIDSVIIFSMAYPGFISSSKCDTGMFPITTFIIWNKNNLTNIRKIEGACFFDVVKFSSLHLFDYYGHVKDKIKSEYFMPVIFSGQINKDKTVSYSMSWIDHEPNYSFYYVVGSDSRSYQFSESYIADKKSLFHYHNSNLAAFHWWQLVKNELDKQD
jgi:hypothetical protein